MVNIIKSVVIFTRNIFLLFFCSFQQHYCKRPVLSKGNRGGKVEGAGEWENPSPVQHVEEPLSPDIHLGVRGLWEV